MNNIFLKKFLRIHFEKYWLIYLILGISLIYLFFSPQDSKKINRIVEGISLSYIAAYIFFLFLNVVPEYFAQKESISINYDNFNTICIKITEIISIIKLFSNDNFDNIVLPNEIKYVKYEDARIFFNPREELSNSFSQIRNSILSIEKNSSLSLPLELNITLVKIEKNCKEFSQNLKCLYNCLDKNYMAKIGIKNFSEYLLDLENAYKLINQYLPTYNHLRKYDFLSSSEMLEYQNYRQELLSNTEVQKIAHRGQIYFGKNRIQ